VPAWGPSMTPKNSPKSNIDPLNDLFLISGNEALFSKLLMMARFGLITDSSDFVLTVWDALPFCVLSKSITVK